MKIVGHVSAKRILSTPETVREITSLGIGVEVQLSSDILDTFTLKDFGNLKSLIGDALTTVHAPFLDLNPGAADSYVLKATRKRFQETLIAAKVLEAEVIVFHTGYHPAKIDPIFDEWFERAIETFKLVAAETDALIALENVFDTEPSVLKKFVDNLPKNVGVCIDVGHLNLFSKQPVSDWISAFKDRIYEFHVHDNSGVKDEHSFLGSGTVPLKEFFKEVEKVETDYIFNLENKTVDDIKKSLKFLEEGGFLW
ncbi:Sugar phosphate isomerase/epimerase [Desulfurobacterium pacificum]|uniref:Sugar phosphate isomerase/epimerase n=1 Tax=Desulfurobacterium pacificum TaxID=240166 RepID=A0ABY1N8A0_9BACT|nr:sugar phosphate isomerase/epimerase [Desulfurobacterium pacificum]SMP03087.1 Sugar phosphate isomerase/epimerase [Desulfurobacterium pacificum]